MNVSSHGTVSPLKRGRDSCKLWLLVILTVWFNHGYLGGSLALPSISLSELMEPALCSQVVSFGLIAAAGKLHKSHSTMQCLILLALRA